MRAWPKVGTLFAAAAMVAAPIMMLSTGGAKAVSAFTCSGTQDSPGVLAAGTYTDVTVNGACAVNAGEAVVNGTVTVTSGSVLLAAFAMNDQTHSGVSGLTAGNIAMQSGATAVLGCEGQHFGCIDDPSQSNPTLAGAEVVLGNITASSPLGVLVHNTRIDGDVSQNGGGGGLSCMPSGPFAAFQSPVYSDYEDNSIAGSVTVNGLSSCWVGLLRNEIGGSVTMSNNTMADPDAMEVLTNSVGGNVSCANNNPPNQYGDSSGSPNTVAGYATGECGFDALQPDPAPSPAVPASPGPPPMPAKPAVPAGPMTPISMPVTTPVGYTLFGGEGGAFNFGTSFFGAANKQTAAAAGRPGAGGYCFASPSGHEWGFGTDSWSCQSAPLASYQHVTGLTAAPFGDGYYTVTADGAVFTSGDAPFFGSAAGWKLGGPIVGLAATPSGDGYYLVGSDGGVITYGGAVFHGSAGNIALNQPIVGMAVDPMTGGYWLVAADGGVFTYGPAPFLGSAGNIHLKQPIVGIAAAPTGDGYYLVAADGGVFTFGPGARFQGALASEPVVGMSLG